MPEDLLHTEAGAPPATQQIKAAQQKNLGRGRGVAVGGHTLIVAVTPAQAARAGKQARGVAVCERAYLTMFHEK